MKDQNGLDTIDKFFFAGLREVEKKLGEIENLGKDALNNSLLGIYITNSDFGRLIVAKDRAPLYLILVRAFVENNRFQLNTRNAVPMNKPDSIMFRIVNASEIMLAGKLSFAPTD